MKTERTRVPVGSARPWMPGSGGSAAAGGDALALRAGRSVKAIL
jgi:hypothetical protein